MSEEEKNEDFTGVEESPKRGIIGFWIYIILLINTFFIRYHAYLHYFEIAF